MRLLSWQIGWLAWAVMGLACSGEAASLGSGTTTGDGATSKGDADVKADAGKPPAAEAGVGRAPCDPLATHSTKLATILGVGKDPSGTLYVADVGGIASQPSIVRLFVSSGGTLYRQYVIGTSQSGNTKDGSYSATFESADGSSQPRDLVMPLSGGVAKSMTLEPEGAGKRPTDSGTGHTVLTLVAASTVSGMPAIDLPGAVSLSSSAGVAEGYTLRLPTPTMLTGFSFECL